MAGYMSALLKGEEEACTHFFELGRGIRNIRLRLRRLLFLAKKHVHGSRRGEGDGGEGSTRGRECEEVKLRHAARRWSRVLACDGVDDLCFSLIPPQYRG